VVRNRLCAAASAAALASGWGASAHAEDLSAAVAKLQQQVAAQAQLLSAQEQLLNQQKARLEKQDSEIEQLRALTDVALATARGAGAGAASAPASAPPPIQIAQATPVVGQPPPEQENKVVVASVPEEQGVLTPHGHFIVEPQFDYAHGSTNRLVFRGVVIVPGINIGIIDASNANRNAVSPAIDLKYGLTNRLEIEARVPYVYRNDRVETVSQRDQTVTQAQTLIGSNIGDVELSARYQLNKGEGGWPIFIGGLRVKSDTGTSPYTIAYDQFGAATGLATGSGFWGVEGSLTFLYPSDPVVMFGGVSYFDQFTKVIDREVGGALVGKVNPGDSISANLGFGFAVNPRFSFSLGYKHTYIFGSKVQLGDSTQNSDSLQVGQFNVGWSFQLSDRITLTNTYYIGATRDAPDMEVLFRIPIRF
jgi:hypothetical protein